MFSKYVVYTCAVVIANFQEENPRFNIVHFGLLLYKLGGWAFVKNEVLLLKRSQNRIMALDLD